MNLRKLLELRVVRYLVAGALSAGIEMLMLITMVEYFMIDVFIANSIAVVCANVFNYILSRNWVFNQQLVRKRVEFPMFMFFVTCGLILNYIILWYLTESLTIDYRISKLIAIAAVVVWNFFTRNNIIFKKTRGSAEDRP